MTESGPATRKQISPATQNCFVGVDYLSQRGIANRIASGWPLTSQKLAPGIYGNVQFYRVSNLMMPGLMAK